MPLDQVDCLHNAPLKGLVVVDMSRYIAGPYCTMLMADAGATVIKVEPPAGDDTRHLEPFISTRDGNETSAFFMRMNRGKRSIALDLKNEEDRQTLAELIVQADVLVENYAAGVLARLGFGESRIAELNGSVVYCSISGFGHTESPMRDRPSYNIVAEYEAGIYYQQENTATPAPIGPPVGDMFPALHALSGLMMALYRKALTGKGGRVDISMYDSMLSLNEIRSSYALLYGDGRMPSGQEFYAPYGVFPVQDGYICIDVTTTAQWQHFCQAIGHPEIFDQPGLTTGPDRAARFDEVIAKPLDAWLTRQTRDSAVQTLCDSRVPCAAIRKPGEALTSPQSRSRNMVVEVGDGRGASIPTVGNPIKIDGITATTTAMAPQLNADRDWIMSEYLGASQHHKNHHDNN